MAYVKVVAGVKRKTISALVYPVDPACCCRCVVVAIIVLRVVPEFGAFYKQFGAELPLSTRIIVAVSKFAGAYFSLLVLWPSSAPSRRSGRGCGSPAIACASTAGRCGARCSGRSRGSSATSQAARTLATLLGGGIPLVNAIDVSAALDPEPVHGAGAAIGGAAGA